MCMNPNPIMGSHAKPQRRKEAGHAGNKPLSDSVNAENFVSFASLRLCVTSFHPITGFRMNKATKKNLKIQSLMKNSVNRALLLELAFPFRQRIEQFTQSLRLRGRQVMPLAQIVAQMEEVRKAVLDHQLPRPCCGRSFFRKANSPLFC